MNRISRIIPSRPKSQNEGFSKVFSSSAATEDVIIAFMGITGSGKSSFIKALTGRSDIVVGDGLESTTVDVQSYRITINSINFVLVDTPGFNDTYRSDGDILKRIAEWLNSTYRQGAKLTGIIYLHPIKENRMEGSALQNFRAFQRLCGEDNFEHIVLCTTFWDTVEEVTGVAREKELCENPEFWAKMMGQGSQVVRIRDYAQSKDVLMQMSRKSTVTLEIQKEMVEERRSLDDTAVGKAMHVQVAQMKAEHEAQLARAKLEAAEILKKHKKEQEEELERHQSVRDAQQRLYEVQVAEQERLKARLHEAERESEVRKQAEQKRLQEIEAENKRLAAEKERLLDERARKDAEDKRAMGEQRKALLCKQYRAEFASQTQALDRARGLRVIASPARYTFAHTAGILANTAKPKPTTSHPIRRIPHLPLVVGALRIVRRGCAVIAVHNLVMGFISTAATATTMTSTSVFAVSSLVAHAGMPKGIGYIQLSSGRLDSTCLPCKCSHSPEKATN